MGMALYRKYRTTSLSETAGQEHITSTLQNALKTNRISHAYLFTGPRGVGKTSVARILAHEVNNLPYSEDSSHLDIIEIDAASNRRIDEIRELRERVHTAPTSAKFKVYIIDEVHMLTKEAFNALLKTLEEPPAHVIFILATTEAHKLPDTIVSRTQRFTFKPYDTATVVSRLRYISDKEGFKISDDALRLIAEAGRGSFRDSISLLDQAGNSTENVGEDQVRRVLGIVPGEAIASLIATLDNKDAKAALEGIKSLRDAGYQSTQIARQLVATLREKMLSGDISDERIHKLTIDLIEIPTSYDADTKLDLIILGQTIDLNDSPSRPSMHPSPQATPQPASELSAQAVIEEKPAPSQKNHTPKPQAIPEPTKPPADATPDGEAPEWWNEALISIKKTHNTIYSVARMAQPQISGDELILRFAFPFHQKRINEAKNKQIISEIAENISGKAFAITCIVDKDAKASSGQVEPGPSPTTLENKAPDLSAIKNVFGDAEVLPE